MWSSLSIQFGVEIRRSFNPAFCSTLSLDQDAQNFIQPGFQYLSRLLGLPIPLFDCPQEEKPSSYLQMESLLIQFMMHSLPFHHTQLQRPVFPLLDDPLPDAVKLMLCPLEVSSSPNWTSPISSAALTGQCSSPTTTLLILPNILGCTAQSCLHCLSVRQSSSPLSPAPDVIILSFSLLRWRILLQFLLNFMSPFLQPV